MPPIHISYHANPSGDPDDDFFLKHAWLQGATWFSQTIDYIGEPDYNRGRSSVKLNRADVPYISYYHAANRDLNLAYLSGTDWITQIVDSAGDVGQFSSLALDKAGCPHISYHDATNGDLKYAYLPPMVNYLPVILKNH